MHWLRQVHVRLQEPTRLSALLLQADQNLGGHLEGAITDDGDHAAAGGLRRRRQAQRRTDGPADARILRLHLYPAALCKQYLNGFQAAWSSRWSWIREISAAPTALLMLAPLCS